MTEPVNVTISVTKATYSSASYSVSGPGATYLAFGTLTNNVPSFQVTVHPLKDVYVNIHVASKDGIAAKSYQIEIQYPRTIQEGLSIGTSSYRIPLPQQQPGDEIVWSDRIRSFTLQKGSVNGQRLRETDTIKLFEPGASEPFLTCTYYSCGIPEEKVANTVGTWDVQIIKDGQIYAEGQYQYDISNVNVVADNGAIEPVPYTTQELIEEFVKNPGMTSQFSHGYQLYVNKDKLLAVFPNARYLNTSPIYMFGQESVLPEGLTKEDYKLGTMPSHYGGTYVYPAFSSHPDNRQKVWGSLWSVSDDPNGDKQVKDMFIFAGVYDENFQLLGQIITTVTFDAAHAAAGYIPERNWQPILP